MTAHDSGEPPHPDTPREPNRPDDALRPGAAGPPSAWDQRQPPPVQPGYGQGQSTPRGQGPLPGNPYAQPHPGPPGAFGPPQVPPGPAGFGPPGPGRPSRFRARRGWLVLGALAAALAVVGGAVFFTGGAHGDRDPVAGPSAPPSASASPSVDQGDGRGTGSGGGDYDPNAGIRAGEARVWLNDNETPLTQDGAWQYGPWRVGDVMVKAMYKEVTGYGEADGKERWKVAFDTPLCGVPRTPSTQNKLVVGLLESNTKGAHCKLLQQVDLATGKAGWKAVKPEDRPDDSSLTLNMAISGDTVALAWPGGATGFSVTDGHKLYDLRRSGGCSPQGFAGGARLISVAFCFDGTGVKDQPGDLIQELDPATGRAKWSYQYEKGWRVGQVLSVEPLVATALPQEGKSWKILAFTADGRLRSRTEPKFKTPGVCSGFGQSVDRLQDCYSAVADARTLYVGGDGTQTDGTANAEGTQVVAVDLDTGREKWRVSPSVPRTVRPLAVEDGKVVVYLEAGSRLGAAVAALAPTGGTPQVLVQSPQAAADAERSFFSARLAWSGGRLFLLNNRVETSKPNLRSHAALSFGR
ncbi:PQQ-binding-like beta-propeller repeat protein [Streptomyces xanthochromogenes]|uniref:outer membrane protein assembly factor BamB family protein n=1 Tax=Streptomyces xanthochromogenes TaxID=67384 RepID=UPI0034200BC8